jgi:hypothetical protein
MSIWLVQNGVARPLGDASDLISAESSLAD